MSNLLAITLGFGALIGMVGAMWVVARCIGRFDRMRRYNLVAALLVLLSFALLLYDAVARDGEYWPAALLLVSTVCMWWEALRPKGERENRKDYAHNPDRCGRCKYDLHGTVEPTCPECGWEIPSDISRIERRDWPMWWRRWRIDHLDNWKKSMANMSVILLGFIIMLAWAAWITLPPIVVIAGVMSLQFGINLVRVGQYGMRATHKNIAASRN